MVPRGHPLLWPSNWTTTSSSVLRLQDWSITDCCMDLPFFEYIRGDLYVHKALEGLVCSWWEPSSSHQTAALFQVQSPFWPQPLMSTQSQIKYLQNPQQGRLLGPMDSKKPETSTLKIVMKAERPEGKTRHIRRRLLESSEVRISRMTHL